MKKLITLFLFLPVLAFGQNPFSERSIKKPNNQPKSFEAEVIDGRNTNSSSYFQANTWTTLVTQTAGLISYRLKYSTDLGLPIWLEVYAPEPTGGFGESQIDDNYSVEKVEADLPTLFSWNEHSRLVKTDSKSDDLGHIHNRYHQYFKHVKVKGGEWIIHSNNNTVYAANGRIYPSINCETEAKIDEASALSVAEKVGHKLHPHAHHSEALSMLDYDSDVELVIDFNLAGGLNPQLVYLVEIRPTDLHYYKVWVDAINGDVLKVLDQLCSVDGPKTANATDLNNVSRSINTYQKGSTYYLIDATKSMFNSGQSSIPNDPVGAIWTIDADNSPATEIFNVTSSDNTWSDKSSVSAHYNAGLAFDYFKNTHNRNSINGSGGTIISVVNTSDDDGSSLANAYWNGQAMFYGNGGTSFKPLAGALDVAGHELTHGVVSNSANLEYEGQSGAINESMADIFGAMIDRDDWKMGEDVVNTSVFPSGALRNLQNPHNGGNSLSDRGYQPEEMSEYYTGSADNYGVHINSGIVNRAYYLIATAIGKDKAEKIYYRALVVYLTSQSQFLDLRYAVEKSADDLFGTAEVNAIKSAFDEVQIFDPNAGSGGGGSTGSGTDLPTNPGTENIISVDINPSDPNTFYKSTTTPDGWIALSTKTPKRKASITDDGAVMYYVSSADELHRIILSSPYTESVISTDPWDNVAVSKDGNLLALISTDIDSSIWVYNFELSQFKQFKLYNPTYTEGVNGGNVLFADAIEFDNTGQYVLYDARNVIENGSGADIEYWDVGVIRVWDLVGDNWGDGKVEKLFTQLPDGVSIGNATYSKNSPYIVAFDYIDVNSASYAVLGTNTLNNETETIFSHSKLGYPNYSNKDDKIIFDAATQGGDDVIAVQELDADKINPKPVNASVLIADGKWGVWYANGTRNLLNSEKDILSFAFPTVEETPATISGTNITIQLPAGTSLTQLVPTFTYSSDAIVRVGSTVQTSGVTSNNFTKNVVYKVTAQDGSTKNYTVKVTVEQSTGINELARTMKLYPNPAMSKLNIHSNIKLNEIKCFSVSGQELKIPLTNRSLDISRLSPGVYFVQLHTEKGVVVKRFTKH